MLATSSATIAEQQPPRDFGQAIAAEYWACTVHVFSNQGKGKPCGLCLRPAVGGHSCAGSINPGSGPDCGPECVNYHREPEPYGPKPTIATVVDDGRVGHHFTATLSCGHGPVGFATTPEGAPQVGQPYDCWDCQRPVDDRNHPPLPDEIIERIESLMPKCPTCGGGIDKIPFIKRTVHKYSADLDSRSGEIMAASEHDDTLDEQPESRRLQRFVMDGPGTAHGVECDIYRVECADGHEWDCDRLQYRYANGEHAWTVLPPSDLERPQELELVNHGAGFSWLRPERAS